MTEDKPWLSLPDEEPPERGLAELMAAARMKAEVMVHPPWWKRALDLLRRPPVLALATIVVLLGGVIVVGRHPDQVQAPAPAATPADVPVLAPPPPPPPPVAAPGEAVAAPQIVARPDVGAQPESAKHEDKKPVAVKATPRTIDKVANEHAATDQTATGHAATVKAAADQKALDRETVELAAPDPVAVTGGDDGAPVQQGMVKPTTQNVTADPLARCRAAAARKDCAGAKACAREVEKADPSYYRANASKDAALKSCL